MVKEAMSETSYKPAVQGIGWVLLRSRDPAALSRFYQDALGLTELRSWPGGHMLWAGPFTVIETNRLDSDAKLQPAAAPDLCDVVPVYGVLRGSGLALTECAGELEIGGQTIQCALDPDGNWYGIEEIDAPPNGGSVIDGVPDQENGLIGLVRAVYRSPDPDRQSLFYRELFGLGQSASADGSLDLGQGTTAHFLPGRPARRIPKDREDIQRTLIPRVYGFEHFVTKAEILDARLINALEFKGGRLNYYLDPVDQLFGFQERKPFDPDIPTTQMVEDVAAWYAYDGVRRA